MRCELLADLLRDAGTLAELEEEEGERRGGGVCPGDDGEAGVAAEPGEFGCGIRGHGLQRVEQPVHDVDAGLDFAGAARVDLGDGPFGGAQVGGLEEGEVVEEGEEPGEGAEGCKVGGAFLEERDGPVGGVSGAFA